MFNPPKTIKEAKAYRYHKWAGNPNGRAYKEGFCSWQVWEVGRAITSHQCSRKNGHGPAGLYCRQHAKMVETH